MTSEEIMVHLPYSPPFLFVDELTAISDTGITGNYTYDKGAYFYEGHFKDNPITPGVILTETMAQIGVVSLGILLMSKTDELADQKAQIAMTSNQIDFFLPVYPGETVKVISKKEYFRFNKLKCQVELYNSEEKLVCRGSISGMINPPLHA